MKYFRLGIIVVTIVFGTSTLVWYAGNREYANEQLWHASRLMQENLAGVFFTESRTIAQLQTKYDETEKTRKPVRILIVPGHEPNFGGAAFHSLWEREMVVTLSNYIEALFKQDSHFEVTVARDTDAWNPLLQKYFTEHATEISEYREDQKYEMTRLVDLGLITQVSGVFHNTAPSDVALRLYGINKWANENNIDIALHVHVNDYPRKSTAVPGPYSGFSIYVPERQYSNSTSSRAIADAVFKRLSKYLAVSDLPVENEGVIEDQELIAIGRYNTLDAPSMLIEYGYIYEGQYSDARIRDAILNNLALQTYTGIQDFFDDTQETQASYDTTLLPHTWNTELSSFGADSIDVLALQAALRNEGVYPPSGRTLNDCPLTGRFRTCTTQALAELQNQNAIQGENGVVGPKTQYLLNSRYGKN